MKKFLSLLFVVSMLTFASVGVTQASTVGLVDVTKGISFGGGYEQSERDLDPSTVTTGFGSFGTSSNSLEVDRKYAEVNYGLNDSIGLLFRIGEQETDLDGTVFGTRYSVDIDDALFIGLGVEAEYPLTGSSESNSQLTDNISIFGQYQYITSNPDIDGATVGSFTSTAFKGDVDYDEHQVAVGLKKEIAVKNDVKVTPYGGVSYSQVNLDADVSVLGLNLASDFEETDQIGSFAGVELAYKNDYKANFEGTFGSNEGFGAGASVKIAF